MYGCCSLISLLLGRPAFFHDCDAAVRHSEPLPFVSPLIHAVILSMTLIILRDNSTLVSWLKDATESKDVACTLLPYLRALGELSKICHQLLSHVFTVRSSLITPSETVLKTLENLDHSLCKWHNDLHVALRWNRWSVLDASVSDHVFTLQ